MSYYPNVPQPYLPYPAPVALPVVQYDPPRITSEEGPSPEKPHGLWSSRYTLVFGIVAIVVTALAIALAALAPALSARAASAVPAGWTKVYDGNPGQGEDWAEAAGCEHSDAGLRITGNDARHACALRASVRGDIVSGGFSVEATMGPAAQVPTTEEGGILVGDQSNTLAAFVDQSGAYRLCTQPCTADSSAYATGEAIAWHADGYTPNTIALRYLADRHIATLFINGQQVASVRYDPPADSEIALGATLDAQALFTHATVYSASA